MERLGRLLIRKPVAWATVVIALLLTALGLYHARNVDQDDDILAFLPKTNTEVAQFHEINERFGGLNVALVGIPVDDPFDPAFLRTLREVTRELDAVPTIDRALSIANVEDFSKDPAGGIRTDYLIGEIPEGAEAKAELRKRVMSRDQVVGILISADAKAIVLYCFATHDADTRAFAGTVREIVNRGMPEHTKYWGGAPFISTYIYDLSEQDMQRLIPWAVVVIVLIVVISFRDLLGAGLALLSTGMGIVMSRGLMGLFGVNANIVLASMPVILFAVGSAYGIHILVRYYDLARDHDRDEALVRTMGDIGPTVLAAGLTTVAGLLSFMMMDIAPMRTFGLFTAVGILAALILALTFVPAVIKLAGLKGRRPQTGPLAQLLVRLTRFARTHRVPFIAGLAVLTVAASLTAGRVEARMESAAFFEAGSPPDQAERFLKEHFGGSNFIQIQVSGDMTDPHTLREVQRIADSLEGLPHVNDVNHIGNVLAVANESMSDERRLPVTTEQVRALYRVLQGNSAIRQLVTDDHGYGMLHVRIDTDRFEDVEFLLAQVERWVDEQALHRYAAVGRDSQQGAKAKEWLRDLVLARVLAHLERNGVELQAAQRVELGVHLGAAVPTVAPEVIEARLTSYLRSDESLLEPEQHQLAEPIATRVTALGAKPSDEELTGAVAAAIERPADDELVDDLSISLETPLAEIWRQEQASERARRLLYQASVELPADEHGARVLAGVAHGLLDLELDQGLVAPPAGAEARELGTMVNGQPVLYRGLSKSVTANQFKSLGFALALVLIIMCLLFRSLWSGLLAAVPTVLTLLVVYGIMGLRGMHLDIGTSMLASIIIGAGVDYAVHLLAAWRAERGEPLIEAAARSASRAGPAIWTNALMVAAGFFVLTLGEAKPLQNVGGLTSTAMITAALATFLALPVLARRRSYRSHGGSGGHEPVAAAEPADEQQLKAAST